MENSNSKIDQTEESVSSKKLFENTQLEEKKEWKAMKKSLWELWDSIKGANIENIEFQERFKNAEVMKTLLKTKTVQT